MCKGGRILVYDFDVDTCKGRLIRGLESLLFDSVYFRSFSYVLDLLAAGGFHIQKKIQKNYWFILSGVKGE